ncbi:NmrA family NAD(P)-binding protein [Leifsonia aquatica]|uniref:NmrA family NAD(P)-binding protein n=1 Tax=Leifsonia aquatica TaxID=144185 RepID=UPI0028ADB342|nr:NmrA family NAD(P)-binding protein [Leifsonia aquatica]
MTAVLLVGATGTLGGRIADKLLTNGDAEVRLLVRDATSTDQSKAAALTGFTDRGATLMEANLNNPPSLETATRGIDVVISAVQGGRDTIVDGQVALARAAKASGAHRFIPSDFALNIWEAPQGAPMFALRREADAAIDQLGGLDVIHVLNGAFMDMMLDPRTAGVVDLEAGMGNYYGDGSDEFDITLIEDIAAFTARIAIDESATAGIYPISGARTSFNEIIAEVERVSGKTLTRNHRGSIEDLQTAVTTASNAWSVIGQWYNYSMLTTPPFTSTENERYADVRVTSLRDYLVRTLDTSS